MAVGRPARQRPWSPARRDVRHWGHPGRAGDREVVRTPIKRSAWYDVAWPVLAGTVAAAGVILAYVWEYLDPTIQDEADAQRWLGAPTLAVIPGGSRARRTRSA